MMKKYLYIITSFLLLSGIAYAYYGGSSGVMTDTNCNQAQYFNIGVLCQDADDGKLYKGTGSAIEQIQAYDADLDTWAGITPSTDIQDFLGAANDTAARTELGLGSIATQNADNVTITGGSVENATIAPKIITKSGSGSLSAAECTGTIIHLYGQTLDTTLELPAAFANGNFVFVVDATVDKYVRLDPTGSEVQSLDGTDLTAGYYVGLTTAVKGAVIQYIAIRTGASTYQWAAFTVTSAWTPQS